MSDFNRRPAGDSFKTRPPHGPLPREYQKFDSADGVTISPGFVKTISEMLERVGLRLRSDTTPDNFLPALWSAINAYQAEKPVEMSMMANRRNDSPAATAKALDDIDIMLGRKPRA